jgi:hypothetical protein
MVLSIQKCFSLRIAKKIILWKTDFKGIWIKFLLNEALFTDDNKIFELPQQVELITMVKLDVEYHPNGLSRVQTARQ